MTPDAPPATRFTPLRLAVVLAAMLAVLFWVGTVVWWWRIPAARRDGFELMALVFATAYLLVLALPALACGLTGRRLTLGAALGAIALALASDVLFPWFPWR